jgi:hypothetical protein
MDGLIEFGDIATRDERRTPFPRRRLPVAYRHLGVFFAFSLGHINKPRHPCAECSRSPSNTRLSTAFFTIRSQ